MLGDPIPAVHSQTLRDGEVVLFAEQILDIIENGSERFPGIARNGVINRYVEKCSPGVLCPDSRAGSYSGAR
jgi:hypothetical protein